jgi:hypothetical protein
MRVSSANTPQNFRILLLEESSYSNYDRPRKKTREIPSDVIIIGSQRLDRECSIQASSRDRVLGYDSRYNSATNLVASALSKGVTNRNFPAGLKIAAITFLSDSSGPADIILGTIVFSKRQPREALNIVDGDTCLLPVEHMKNRFIQRGGEKTYRRTDDIWFCTDGLLTGGADAAAIAGNIDIRYFEIASREICASVLGIPVSRSYIVYRDNEGNPGSAWTRCLGTEDWKKVTDKAIIKEHDSK